MKNIGGFVFAVLMVLSGCDGEGSGMGMPSDSGGDVVGTDTGTGMEKEDAKVDVKGDSGGSGSEECTIFYNKDGYDDPCRASGKFCQSPEISESISNRRVITPGNVDGKMTGVCSDQCVLYDGSGRTFTVGQECGEVGLFCKMVLNHGNVRHPICMGS